MIQLFIALSIANIACLLAATGLGYLAGAGGQIGYHTLGGVSATLVCVAVHCVVMTYFMATTKWVRYAVALKRLDPSSAEPTRSFRAQAFPAALLAIAFVFLAALLGVLTDAYDLRPIWHHIAALLAIAANIVATFFEGRAIRRNGRLIDGILSAIALGRQQTHK